MARDGGLWQDLKAAGGRVLEVAQERTGTRLIRSDDFERVVEAAADGAVYRRELEYVGWTIISHVGGSGAKELKAESRRTLALKSLNAYISDPNAGRYVDLYCGFVFGRGVPKPQARDPEVQKVIDATWKDRANRRILTSPQKLVEKGRDFCIQSTIGFLFFDDGLDGRVRMSLLNFDTIDHGVTHDDDRFRLLYVACLEKKRTYSFADHRYVEDPGPPKHVYYEAIDAFAVDDDDHPEDDESITKTPAPGEMGDGKVLLLTTNKTSEMIFGVPGFKRMLRWYTGYNEVLESFTERMKAAARLYMKASVTGGQSAVERAGLMAVRRASPLGAGVPAVEGDPASGQGGMPGRGQMGVVAGNPAMNYEPFKIDSGAGDVAAASPVLRSQVSGPWPDAYLGGDPGSLAGGQSLELPTLKFVEQEQELWALPFRALADRAIKRAVEMGDLDEWRAPTESEQRAIDAGLYEGEIDDRGRVERDLSYSFALPNPVQRAMGDFVTAAVAVATAVDPNGDFPELSRWLLGFCLAEAFDVDDPQKVVDEVLPLEKVRELEAQRQAQQEMALAGAQAAADAARQAASGDVATSTGADGKQHPPGNLNGAQQESAPPEQKVQQAARVREAAEVGRRGRARRAARPAREETVDDYESIVGQTVSAQLRELEMAGSHNANGGSPS
jgi:hypothetical protein